ncbi:MAG TPA: hypothetical protein VGB13_10930 [Candidatus Krumholzibacteria bacterium]
MGVMREFVLMGFVLAGCFREAYPCDEETAAVLIASCRAKYEECRLAGHAADCPATDECRQIALERQAYCATQIQENP